MKSRVKRQLVVGRSRHSEQTRSAANAILAARFGEGQQVMENPAGFPNELWLLNPLPGLGEAACL